MPRKNSVLGGGSGENPFYTGEKISEKRTGSRKSEWFSLKKKEIRTQTKLLRPGGSSTLWREASGRARKIVLTAAFQNKNTRT